MRLQRYGKKGQPFYHIVIADGRAPRDGRFIEKIGAYNPLTIPATIELDMDKALSWLQKGASPSETAKAILSYKGILYKDHLMKGVAKGALTQEMAEAKFQKWVDEKQAKIASKISQKAQESKSELKKKHEAEAKINEEREAALATKRAKALEKEEAKEEAKAEEPAQEVAPEPEQAASEAPATEA
jgi:small subunit ribosomal protein S16